MKKTLDRIAARAAAVLVAAVLLAAAQGQTPPPAPKVTAVRAARMIDVRAGTVVENAVVLVENGRVTAAGAARR